MTLIAFHKFLISTAIVFSIGLAVRQFAQFGATGNPWDLLAAIGVSLVAVILGYYLIHLRDFLRLPSRGSGLKAAGGAGLRSGNGSQPLSRGTAALPQPEIPPEKGNGHDEQDYDELRKHSKH